MNIDALQLKAMRVMLGVTGGKKTVIVDGENIVALVSECTSVINAMRGKVDNLKRYEVAIVLEDVPEGKRAKIKPRANITIDSIIKQIEEQDFRLDSGVVTFFAA